MPRRDSVGVQADCWLLKQQLNAKLREANRTFELHAAAGHRKIHVKPGKKVVESPDDMWFQGREVLPWMKMYFTKKHIRGSYCLAGEGAWSQARGTLYNVWTNYNSTGVEISSEFKKCESLTELDAQLAFGVESVAIKSKVESNVQLHQYATAPLQTKHEKPTEARYPFVRPQQHTTDNSILCAARETHAVVAPAPVGNMVLATAESKQQRRQRRLEEARKKAKEEGQHNKAGRKKGKKAKRLKDKGSDADDEGEKGTIQQVNATTLLHTTTPPSVQPSAVEHEPLSALTSPCGAPQDVHPPAPRSPQAVFDFDPVFASPTQPSCQSHTPVRSLIASPFRALTPPFHETPTQPVQSSVFVPTPPPVVKDSSPEKTPKTLRQQLIDEEERRRTAAKAAALIRRKQNEAEIAALREALDEVERKTKMELDTDGSESTGSFFSSDSSVQACERYAIECRDALKEAQKAAEDAAAALAASSSDAAQLKRSTQSARRQAESLRQRTQRRLAQREEIQTRLEEAHSAQEELQGVELRLAAAQQQLETKQEDALQSLSAGAAAQHAEVAKQLREAKAVQSALQQEHAALTAGEQRALNEVRRLLELASSTVGEHSPDLLERLQQESDKLLNHIEEQKEQASAFKKAATKHEKQIAKLRGAAESLKSNEASYLEEQAATKEELEALYDQRRELLKSSHDSLQEVHEDHQELLSSRSVELRLAREQLYETNKVITKLVEELDQCKILPEKYESEAVQARKLLQLTLLEKQKLTEAAGKLHTMLTLVIKESNQADVSYQNSVSEVHSLRQELAELEAEEKTARDAALQAAEDVRKQKKAAESKSMLLNNLENRIQCDFDTSRDAELQSTDILEAGIRTQRHIRSAEQETLKSRKRNTQDEVRAEKVVKEKVFQSANDMISTITQIEENSDAFATILQRFEGDQTQTRRRVERVSAAEVNSSPKSCSSVSGAAIDLPKFSTSRRSGKKKPSPKRMKIVGLKKRPQGESESQHTPLPKAETTAGLKLTCSDTESSDTSVFACSKKSQDNTLSQDTAKSVISEEQPLKSPQQITPKKVPKRKRASPKNDKRTSSVSTGPVGEPKLGAVDAAQVALLAVEDDSHSAVTHDTAAMLSEISATPEKQTPSHKRRQAKESKKGTSKTHTSEKSSLVTEQTAIPSNQLPVVEAGLSKLLDHDDDAKSVATAATSAFLAKLSATPERPSPSSTKKTKAKRRKIVPDSFSEEIVASPASLTDTACAFAQKLPAVQAEFSQYLENDDDAKSTATAATSAFLAKLSATPERPSPASVKKRKKSQATENTKPKEAPATPSPKLPPSTLKTLSPLRENVVAGQCELLPFDDARSAVTAATEMTSALVARELSATPERRPTTRQVNSKKAKNVVDSPVQRTPSPNITRIKKATKRKAPDSQDLNSSQQTDLPPPPRKVVRTESPGKRKGKKKVSSPVRKSETPSAKNSRNPPSKRKKPSATHTPAPTPKRVRKSVSFSNNPNAVHVLSPLHEKKEKPNKSRNSASTAVSEGSVASWLNESPDSVATWLKEETTPSTKVKTPSQTLSKSKAKSPASTKKKAK